MSNKNEFLSLYICLYIATLSCIYVLRKIAKRNPFWFQLVEQPRTEKKSKMHTHTPHQSAMIIIKLRLYIMKNNNK